MNPELIWVGKYLFYFFLAQLAILWLLLPLAIFGIKRRLESMTQKQGSMVDELFRLRKTLETLPGATPINSRLANITAQREAETRGEVSDDRIVDVNDEEDAQQAVPKPVKKKRKAGAVVAQEDYVDDSADYEDDSLDYADEVAEERLVELPMKSRQRRSKVVVDVPEEDEIFEDEEGYFIYRGKRYEQLIEAMRQQQIDASVSQ